MIHELIVFTAKRQVWRRPAYEAVKHDFFSLRDLSLWILPHAPQALFRQRRRALNISLGYQPCPQALPSRFFNKMSALSNAILLKNAGAWEGVSLRPSQLGKKTNIAKEINKFP